MSHTPVKVSCSKILFPALTFCGLHIKFHGVRGLVKHYHLVLYPKLGHGKCSIWQIRCYGVTCINMLDKTWAHDVAHAQQPRYHPVIGCTYWTMLGSLNDWNIIKFKNKNTSSEDFNKVHKVVLGGISSYME